MEKKKIYELDVEAEISDGESTEDYIEDWIRLQNRMNFILHHLKTMCLQMMKFCCEA